MAGSSVGDGGADLGESFGSDKEDGEEDEGLDDTVGEDFEWWDVGDEFEVDGTDSPPDVGGDAVGETGEGGCWLWGLGLGVHGFGRTLWLGAMVCGCWVGGVWGGGYAGVWSVLRNRLRLVMVGV